MIVDSEIQPVIRTKILGEAVVLIFLTEIVHVCLRERGLFPANTVQDLVLSAWRDAQDPIFRKGGD